MIDIIFTNITDCSTNDVLIDDTVSDHLPIFTCIKMKNVKASNRFECKYMRCMSEKNYDAFNEDLKQINWESFYDILDVNEAYEKFIVTLKDL